MISIEINVVAFTKSCACLRSGTHGAPQFWRLPAIGLSLSWCLLHLSSVRAASPAGASSVPERPPVVGQSRWQPTDPIRVGRGNAYLDLGLVGTMTAGGSTASDIGGGTQLGGHDPNQRGFTLQGVELNISGAVDPYFRGNVNLSYALDAENESLFELEEAWMETVSLPWNLQLRAGQIYTDMGRQNSLHLHNWSFVDVPLVNGRFFGADGLRNPGVRLSWLVPTPFFSELSVAVQNSHGETVSSFRSEEEDHGLGSDDDLPFGYRGQANDRGVHSIEDLLLSGRYSLSFGLTGTQTLLMGVSAAMGPNNSGDLGGDTQTEIYAIDLLWKWQASSQHGGFPFLAWQTEAMYRRYDAGTFDWSQGGPADNDQNGFPDESILLDPQTLLPAVMARETLTDYGLYTQLLYGFSKGWVAGLRYDYLDSDRGDYEQRGLLVQDNTGAVSPAGRDPARDRRWRLSPNLTWYPSEYSKIRLQYNYDDRRYAGEDHSVWLQFEFSMGSHPAHRF